MHNKIMSLVTFRGDWFTWLLSGITAIHQGCAFGMVIFKINASVPKINALVLLVGQAGSEQGCFAAMLVVLGKATGQAAAFCFFGLGPALHTTLVIARYRLKAAFNSIWIIICLRLTLFIGRQWTAIEHLIASLTTGHYQRCQRETTKSKPNHLGWLHFNS